MKYKEFLGKKVKLTLKSKKSFNGFLFFGKRYSGFARKYVLVLDDLTHPTAVDIIFSQKVIEDIKLYDE